jgi:hypothetical protein
MTQLVEEERMTPHQETAYAHPCFEAEECNHPRYQWIEARGGLTISLIMTANIGLE